LAVELRNRQHFLVAELTMVSSAARNPASAISRASKRMSHSAVNASIKHHAIDQRAPAVVAKRIGNADLVQRTGETAATADIA
jgi:hypothetical protein